MLEVESLNWHLLENAKAHHTDKYEIVHEEGTPVLRRSQPFKISITFKNRPFNEAKDNVKLFFSLDQKKENPRLESAFENTTVETSNKLTESISKWSLQLVGQYDKTITLLVRSPPTSAWGIWNLKIKTSLKLDSKLIFWKSPIQFWLLFNPWSKDDDVYMNETRYLDEYVLNDVGKVYTKGIGKPMGLKWIYGQFASPILKVLIKIIEIDSYYRVPLTETERGSPIDVVKRLKAVTSIIQGKWKGDYSDGTAPWLWTGSVPIFEEYLTTEKPAKYGQCFNFAAIFTTALRAAGIPARNVTNFVSSTSGDDSMCLNYIYNTSGDEIQIPSVWNFHVWNDAWMARYDLPPGYGGWQAVDSMGSGPAPLEAIKKGEISLNYDVPYIMAECNADKARWTVDPDGEYHLIKIESSFTGKAMLTKQPFVYDPHGDTDFQDIAFLYKEKEGSREERMAVYKAIRHCKEIHLQQLETFRAVNPEMYQDLLNNAPLRHIDVPLEETSVKFELRQIESILFGETLKTTVIIENVGEKSLTVETCLGSSTVYYNGASASLIKRERKTITVQPKQKCEVTVEIKPEEYASKLVEFTLVQIHCVATVKENKYTWADDFQLHVDMPEIIIEAKDDLFVNKEGVITFQFKNLLKTKLTKGTITYEAPGIGRNVTIPCRDIMLDEDFVLEHKIKPSKEGLLLINAFFKSKELNFLGGSSCIDVSYDK